MNAAAEELNLETGLIPVERVNAISLFTEGGLDDLLGMIEAEATSHTPNLETAAGRSEVASMAYKVSRSKTTIDGAGKDLVSEWKAKAKEVDQARKKARDFLDALRDRVRSPLTEWEAEQERIAAEKKLAEEIAAAHDEALAMNDLFDREAAIREKEEAMRRQAEERAAKERAEQEAKERAEREERIRREAEEAAKREAEEALRLERERAERAEREKAEAAERAEAERVAAIEAERKRAEREAEEKETRRLAEIERQRQEEARRAADKANREKVNKAVIAALVAEGLTNKAATAALNAIAAGGIPHVTINY